MEVYRRLVSGLRLGEGFELHGVDCRTMMVGRELIRRLGREESLQVCGLELANRDPGALVAELLHLQWEGIGRPSVALLGDRTRAKSWAEVARRLNERRNALIRALPGALLWCGPEWFVNLLREEGPDLWSIRTAVHRFPPPLANGPTSLLALSPAPPAPPQNPQTLVELAKQAEAQGDLSNAGSLFLAAANAVTDSLLDRTGFRPLEGSNPEVQQQRLQVEQAKKWAIRAGKLAKRIESRLLESESLNSRARAHLLLARWNQFQSAVARSEALLGGLKDDLDSVQELTKRIRKLGSEGSVGRALQEFQGLHTLTKKSDLNPAFLYELLAEMTAATGRPGEASAILRNRVLPMYESSGDRRERAEAVLAMARYQFSDGHHEAALQAIADEVLPDLELIGADRERFDALELMVEILNARGAVDEAVYILENELVPGWERLGDQQRLLQVQKRLDTLRQLLEAALDA